MNILRFDNIREDLINYFRSKSILPIFGSGFSRDIVKCCGLKFGSAKV